MVPLRPSIWHFNGVACLVVVGEDTASRCYSLSCRYSNFHQLQQTTEIVLLSFIKHQCIFPKFLFQDTFNFVLSINIILEAEAEKITPGPGPISHSVHPTASSAKDFLREPYELLHTELQWSLFQTKANGNHTPYKDQSASNKCSGECLGRGRQNHRCWCWAPGQRSNRKKLVNWLFSGGPAELLTRKYLWFPRRQVRELEPPLSVEARWLQSCPMLARKTDRQCRELGHNSSADSVTPDYCLCFDNTTHIRRVYREEIFHREPSNTQNMLHVKKWSFSKSCVLLVRQGVLY